MAPDATEALPPPDLAALAAEARRTLNAAVEQGQSSCTSRECRHARVVLALVAECERRGAERDAARAALAELEPLIAEAEDLTISGLSDAVSCHLKELGMRVEAALAVRAAAGLGEGPPP